MNQFFNSTLSTLRAENYFTKFESPLGSIILVGSNRGLHDLFFEGQKYAPLISSSWQRDDARFLDVINQLREYFSGTRTKFTVPLDLQGTPFQKFVWSVLIEIPYASTLSYADVARRIGNPRAVRAVGSAIGRNPVSIIVPCHRVIGSSGVLTGYAGGLQRKRRLLELEKKREPMPQSTTLPEVLSTIASF